MPIENKGRFAKTQIGGGGGDSNSQYKIIDLPPLLARLLDGLIAMGGTAEEIKEPFCNGSFVTRKSTTVILDRHYRILV